MDKITECIKKNKIRWFCDMWLSFPRIAPVYSCWISIVITFKSNNFPNFYNKLGDHFHYTYTCT